MNWQDRVSEMRDDDAETPGVKPEKGRIESTDDKLAKERLAAMIAKHDKQRAKHGVKKWFGKGVFTKETGKKNWQIDSPEKEEQIKDRQARRERADDPNRPRTRGPKATHPGSAREVRGGRKRQDSETQMETHMNWQDKIYESLVESEDKFSKKSHGPLGREGGKASAEELSMRGMSAKDRHKMTLSHKSDVTLPKHIQKLSTMEQLMWVAQERQRQRPYTDRGGSKRSEKPRRDEGVLENIYDLDPKTPRRQGN